MRPTLSRHRLRTLAAAVALGLGLASLPALGEPRAKYEPEQSTGEQGSALAVAKRYMIATANPHASEAGLEMLRAGGSAADAAIAAQLVLGLVEPQSSGLGGGAFLLNWDSGSKSLVAYDGRETAPAAAKPDRFLENGEPMPFDRAVKSGLSIGTPGLVKLLETVHGKHGKLPWAKLFEPALRLARDGFPVSTRLHFLLRWNGADSFSEAGRTYFFDQQGSARPTGHLLQNPEYARTLEAISAGGAAAFYTGEVADAIVAAVRAAPNHTGDLTLEDLAGYAVKEREPICVSYRKRRVCGMGPPSSGGTAVAQVLKLIEPFDIGSGPADAMNPLAVHVITEAERLAYADRDRYLADSDFVTVPAGLTDDAYIASRRAQIDPKSAMSKPTPGNPQGSRSDAFGVDATQERVGTSHISVIDGDGNAIALTTTIEGVFGSGVWARGFLLNNQMTDFSFLPRDRAGIEIANRVEPGKRPRSSMAPTIVFDENGAVAATLGSPGGARIILFVIKALVGLIDWELDPAAAAALPNFGSLGGPFEVEFRWEAMWHAINMRGLGHDVRPDLMNSGLQIVAVRDGQLTGGADPRREGTAVGD